MNQTLLYYNTLHTVHSLPTKKKGTKNQSFAYHVATTSTKMWDREETALPFHSFRNFSGKRNAFESKLLRNGEKMLELDCQKKKEKSQTDVTVLRLWVRRWPSCPKAYRLCKFPVEQWQQRYENRHQLMVSHLFVACPRRLSSCPQALRDQSWRNQTQNHWCGATHERRKVIIECYSFFSVW